MTCFNIVDTSFKLYKAHNIEERLAEIPLLYHYTSWDAFLKIWQNASLWMSEIGWQNDKQEYRHGIGLINLHTQKHYQTLIAERYGVEGQYPELATTDTSRPAVYTFSLSAKPDLLSQWRGYCPGGGVCFAFRPEILCWLIKKYRLLLAPCQYHEPGQQTVLDTFIFSGKTPGEHANELPVKTYDDFENYFLHEISLRGNVYVPFLKDVAFHEEAEWRLVACSQYLVESQVPDERLRSRGNELVPFVEYSFAGALGAPRLDQMFAHIITGPDQQQTYQALNRQPYDPAVLSITESPIPYRTQ